ncbi:hypothetical protein [Cytophaga aurantiaca]|uniref:hypothetical protein n=1 Tax=Cytophaga aurantiaca TaxID=29530 RepID=UPI000475F889|nr:hypothetical protein [Cytophaga aurantiaca]
MLKFIKHHMTSIGNIEIYPVISFILFFLFFMIMLIVVIRSSKAFIAKMEHLPLEDGTPATRIANTETL